VTLRAAELADGLALHASDLSAHTDDTAVAAEQIAKLSERAAKAAERAAMTARDAAMRAAELARSSRDKNVSGAGRATAARAAEDVARDAPISQGWPTTPRQSVERGPAVQGFAQTRNAGDMVFAAAAADVVAHRVLPSPPERPYDDIGLADAARDRGLDTLGRLYPRPRVSESARNLDGRGALCDASSARLPVAMRIGASSPPSTAREAQAMAANRRTVGPKSGGGWQVASGSAASEF
jgi:hypothetical protein